MGGMTLASATALQLAIHFRTGLPLIASDCLPVRRPTFPSHEWLRMNTQAPLSTRAHCQRNTEKPKKCYLNLRALTHLSLGVGRCVGVLRAQVWGIC